MIHFEEVKKQRLIVRSYAPLFLEVSHIRGEPLYVVKEGKILDVFNPEDYLGTLTEDTLERKLENLFYLSKVDGRINMTAMAWERVKEILENPAKFLKDTNRIAKIRSMLFLRKRLQKEGDPDGKLTKAEFLYFYGATDFVDKSYDSFDEEDED